MKALRYGITGVFAAGLALIAACGGSSDGGMDDPSSGGASHAGAPGSAGRAGGQSNPGGGGAANQNNAACPATAPANATECTLSGAQTTCTYTGMSCSCARVRGGGGMQPGGTAGANGATSSRQWQCMETLVCPATAPAEGEACTPAAGICPYAGSICTCNERGNTWACFGGGMMGGAGAGSGIGGRGNGSAGAPTGGGGRTGGIPGSGGANPGSAGAATTTNCPATKPAADSACTGTDSCPFTGGGCVCMSDKWVCL